MHETEREYERWMKRLAKTRGKTYSCPDSEEEKRKDCKAALRWLEDHLGD